MFGTLLGKLHTSEWPKPAQSKKINGTFDYHRFILWINVVGRNMLIKRKSKQFLVEDVIELSPKYSKSYVGFYVNFTKIKGRSTPKMTKYNREQLRNFDILFLVGFYQNTVSVFLI